MKAVTHTKPYLQSGNCLVTGYDLSWLQAVLQEAAQEAGVKLPFVQEVAQGILLYLEEECPLYTMPLEYLFGRIRKLLREIGLLRVADHLHPQLPPVNIELDELAGENPLPLFFYTALRERMDTLREMGMTTYRFSGAQRCSLVLGHRQRACPTQRDALQELRLFLAAHAA